MNIMDEFDDKFEEFRKEILDKLKGIADEAVSEAVDEDTYQDRTGHLRASNGYALFDDGIVEMDAIDSEFYEKEDTEGTGVMIGNSAFYASFVESKGFNVITNQILSAEEKIKGK